MAVFCSRCGTALPAGARFCSSCGASVVAASRPLMRPIAGRNIAGVCIGLAQANGWDVSIVRVITVVGIFCSGGLIAVAYIACWIGIPKESVPIPGAYTPPQL